MSFRYDKFYENKGGIQKKAIFKASQVIGKLHRMQPSKMMWNYWTISAILRRLQWRKMLEKCKKLQASKLSNYRYQEDQDLWTNSSKWCSSLPWTNLLSQSWVRWCLFPWHFSGCHDLGLLSSLLVLNVQCTNQSKPVTVCLSFLLLFILLEPSFIVFCQMWC